MKSEQTDQISILGLTYKVDTQLVEESAAISIINALTKKGIKVKVYDPAGMDEAKKELVDLEYITFADSAADCLSGTKVCFISTPWDEFKKISANEFVQLMDDNPIIIDGWKLYSFDDNSKLKYVQIGKES